MIRLQGDLGKTIYLIPLVPGKYRVGRRWIRTYQEVNATKEIIRQMNLIIRQRY
jgi:hypothetical protein